MNDSMSRQLPLLVMVGVLLTAVVTALHALAWWIAPFQSLHPEAPAWLTILLFQAVLIGALLLATVLVAKMAPRRAHDYGEELAKINVGWLLGISLGGLLLHVLAKVSLIEDFSLDCPIQLRSIWLAHDRGSDPGWLRVSSMLGYLGAHFALPGLMICAFQITRGQWQAKKLMSFVAFTFVIAVFAAMIVSRTVVLTALIVVSLGVLLGYSRARAGIGRGKSKMLMGGLLSFLFFLFFSILFNAVVFRSKMNCGAVNDEDYVSSNLVGTGVVMLNNSLVNNSPVNSIPVVLPTLSYLNHAVYNLALIHSVKERGDPVLLAFAGVYLTRLGLLPNDGGEKVRVYSRGGPTLPGAAYHDFGYSGLILLAVFLALCWIGGAYLLSLSAASAWFGLTLLVAAGLTMAMSLLFVAMATISFPFVTFAFLSCALSNWITSLRMRKGAVERV